MIGSFLTTEFSTQRLQQTANKSKPVAYITSGVGHLRQLDDRTSEINSIQLGLGFKLTVSGDVDIVATDKVTIAGNIYEVRGVKSENFGSLDYKEIIMVKKIM